MEDQDDVHNIARLGCIDLSPNIEKVKALLTELRGVRVRESVLISIVTIKF